MSAINTIEKILGEAYRLGATDVHLAVGTRPQMRISGQLVGMDYSKVTAQDTLDFILQFMTQNQRDAFEERGEFDFALTLSGCGRLRVSAFKRSGSVALAFRLVGEKLPWPEELGLPEELIRQCEKKSGLVLVTGAVGSGKTTTLAALLNRINESKAVHVITLEQPIEYVHPHKNALINQREVGVDCESYVMGLRAVRKENADVLFLGELSGASAIEEVIKLAEAGVLVFAEITASKVSSASEELVDAFEMHRQERIEKRLKGVLGAVVFQQMFPKEGGGQTVTYEMLDL